MSYLIAYLGTTGLADVGYRFFDTAGIYTGARQTTGVVELPGARGVYFVPSPTIPATATGVYWDSTGTAAAYAYEVFNFRTPNVDTASAGALLTAGTGTAQLSVTSGVASANAVQISGDAAAADNLETMLDGTGGGALNIANINIQTLTSTGAITLDGIIVNDSVVVGGVFSVVGDIVADGITTVSTSTFGGAVTANITGNLSGSVGSVAAGGITAASIATGAIDADALAADAGTEIGTAVWATATRTLSAGAITTATFGAGAIDAAAIGTGAIDADAIAADAIGSSELAASAVAEIAAALAGTGPYPITVTVNDGSTALAGVHVVVYDAGIEVGAGTTSAGGTLALALAASTNLTLTLNKVGYSFTPVVRTVTGSHSGTLEGTFSMAATTTPGVPTDPSMCVVSGYVKNAADELLPNVAVTFTLVPSGAGRPITAGGSVVALRKYSAKTNSAGYLSTEVIRTDAFAQTVTYTIVCEPAEIAETGVTLTAATKDIATL